MAPAIPLVLVFGQRFDVDGSEAPYLAKRAPFALAEIVPPSVRPDLMATV